MNRTGQNTEIKRKPWCPECGPNCPLHGESEPTEFNGLTHQCNDPECHVAGFVKTLRMKAEEDASARVCLECGQPLRRSWTGVLTPTWVHPNGFASCVDSTKRPAAEGGGDA